MNDEQVSPYLARIKDVKVKEMIEKYIQARNLYARYYATARRSRPGAFKELMRICDLLWDAKEGQRLLYKRVVNPKTKKFEDAVKYMPSDLEIEFINNTGLLFHKVLVARELRYVLDHYSEDTEGYAETSTELQGTLQRINALFKAGLEILKVLVVEYADNRVLLAALFEYRSQVERVFEMEFNEILGAVQNNGGLDSVYRKIGEYYLESGWRDRAVTMLQKALELNPKSKKARTLLSSATAAIVQG